MTVASVTEPYEGCERIVMHAVCGKTGENGESEDNTYARYTPCAKLEMDIQNAALHGKIKEGSTFYVDFTEHVA